MAYVLGYWFADGYMRIDKSYRIVFTSSDKLILSNIRKAFSSTHPLKRRTELKGGSYTWTLSIFSKHLYSQLIKLGGTRRKSKDMRFPYVPRNYRPDFIRGYFDGDGSVFFVKYLRTKDKRLTKELRTNFTSGSRMFLEALMQVLNDEISLPVKKLGVYNDGCTLKLGYGMKDSDALLRYMYYDNYPIGLERKARYILQIPEYQKHNWYN